MALTGNHTLFRSVLESVSVWGSEVMAADWPVNHQVAPVMGTLGPGVLAMSNGPSPGGQQVHLPVHPLGVLLGVMVEPFLMCIVILHPNPTTVLK